MISCLILVFILFICLIVATLLLLSYWVRRRGRGLLTHLRSELVNGKTPLVVGFFHPYCNAGGGGERVLWTAIRALQNRYPNVKCIVYTGDVCASSEEILAKAGERFNISLPRRVEFVFLQKRGWVEATRYPFLTLLGQSMGSVYLGWEALLSYVPDVYLDTMGYAFTIPLFKYFGGCSVGSYVHYPTISTDMLEAVATRREAHNNRSFISRNPVLSYVKLIYYKLFAYVYGMVGKQNSVIMVNSSWTRNHIQTLWKSPEKTFVVYPPCDVKEFTKIPLQQSNDNSSFNIVSIAQFRPEKDHELQINSYYEFLKQFDPRLWDQYRLVLVGSCRNADDAARVDSLRELCNQLKIRDYVDFKLNVSFDELKQLLGSSVIGLHTMWNEHFGIGVVEIMSAGTIILAHNSGGPKLDIVIPHNGSPTGFLADDVQSYADAMETITKMSEDERLDIRLNARDSVNRFAESVFEEDFLAATEIFFQGSY